MTLPPENDGTRPSLRETYNNAAAGAGYLEAKALANLQAAQLKVSDLMLWIQFGAVVGFVADLFFLVMGPKLGHFAQVTVATFGAAAIFMAFTPIGNCVIKKVLEPRYGVAKYRAQHERIVATPAGKDGVQRLGSESRFLKTSFAFSMKALVCVHETVIDMEAQLSRYRLRNEYTVSTEELAALRAVHAVRDELEDHMAALEGLWQCRDANDMNPKLDTKEWYDDAMGMLKTLSAHMPFLVLNGT